MTSRLLRAFACLAAAILACTAARAPGVLFEGESAFNPLIVREDAQGIRRLYFERDGAVQSAIKPGAPLELELAYSRAAMLALALVPQPRRVLIVGLGGGAMPMFLRALFPTLEIEVVDIDPKVIEVARRYFGFREDAHLKAFVADGRAFVEKSRGGWDLVFLDAYGKGSIPRHLATYEFLRQVRGKLADGGLVAGNVWEPEWNPLYASMVRTYAEAFSSLCVVNIPGVGNRIFFAERAVPSAGAFVEAAAAFSAKHALPFELSMYARGGCDREVDASALILRDRSP